MNSLAATIKQMADNGQIDTNALIRMAQHQDDIITAARPLLDKCYSQVGLHLGEEIKVLTCRIDGQRFNAVEFHYERPIDGQ